MRNASPATWTEIDDVRAALAASPVEARAAIHAAADALRWTAFKGRNGRTSRALRAILTGGL